MLNWSKFSKASNASTNNDPYTLQIAQAIASLGMSLDFEIQALKEAQIRLQCRNTRVMLTNLQSSQYINPSAALSAVLNRRAYATMSSSLLNELACVPVRGVLKPSLWVGKRLAARPIFEIEFQNRTRLAQMTLGGYLRWGLSSFMPRNEGFLVFRIDKREFRFRNGSLIEEGFPRVIEIGLPSASFTLPVVVPDPSHLADNLEDHQPPPIGLDYLHSSLSALIQLTHTQLTSMGVDEEELATFQDSPITEDLQHSLLSTISEKFSFNQPGWLRALKYTSYAWGIISTLLFLVICFSTFRSCWNRFFARNRAEVGDTPQAGPENQAESAV